MRVKHLKYELLWSHFNKCHKIKEDINFIFKAKESKIWIKFPRFGVPLYYYIFLMIYWSFTTLLFPQGVKCKLGEHGYLKLLTTPPPSLVLSNKLLFCPHSKTFFVISFLQYWPRPETEVMPCSWRRISNRRAAEAEFRRKSLRLREGDFLHGELEVKILL